MRHSVMHLKIGNMNCWLLDIERMFYYTFIHVHFETAVILDGFAFRV